MERPPAQERDAGGQMVQAHYDKALSSSASCSLLYSEAGLDRGLSWGIPSLLRHGTTSH